MIRKLAVCSFVLGAFGIACQLVAGIERVDKVDRPEPEAAPPPPPPPDAAPDPCAHLRPPTEPATEDTGDDLPDFVLAVHTLSLIPENGEPFPGFDLDGVCTCDTREGAFEGGASSCVLPGKACDLDGGLDNVGAQLIKSLAFAGDVNDAANITPRIKSGRQTLLLVISKYNGKANDKEVRLGLVPSDGIRETDAAKRCPGSTEDPLGGHYSSEWCGSDPWSIVTDTALVASGTTLGFAPTVTGTGYVADHTLVVKLVSGTASLPFSGTHLDLGSPIGVMKLVPLDESLMPRDPSRPPTDAEKRLWRVEKGTLAGRLPARDLLAAAGSIVTPGGGGHLCRSALFGQLKNTICDDLDIARATNFDFAPNRGCDALSMGVSFTADPAKWSGEFYKEPEPVTECSAGPDDRPVDAAVDVVYRCDPGQ